MQARTINSISEIKTLFETNPKEAWNLLHTEINSEATTINSLLSQTGKEELLDLLKLAAKENTYPLLLQLSCFKGIGESLANLSSISEFLSIIQEYPKLSDIPISDKLIQFIVQKASMPEFLGILHHTFRLGIRLATIPAIQEFVANNASLVVFYTMFNQHLRVSRDLLSSQKVVSAFAERFKENLSKMKLEKFILILTRISFNHDALRPALLALVNLKELETYLADHLSFKHMLFFFSTYPIFLPTLLKQEKVKQLFSHYLNVLQFKLIATNPEIVQLLIINNLIVPLANKMGFQDLIDIFKCNFEVGKELIQLECMQGLAKQCISYFAVPENLIALLQSDKKLAHFIIDNNKDLQEIIAIQIDHYPEFREIYESHTESEYKKLGLLVANQYHPVILDSFGKVLVNLKYPECRDLDPNFYPAVGYHLISQLNGDSIPEKSEWKENKEEWLHSFLSTLKQLKQTLEYRTDKSNASLTFGPCTSMTSFFHSNRFSKYRAVTYLFDFSDVSVHELFYDLAKHLFYNQVENTDMPDRENLSLQSIIEFLNQFNEFLFEKHPNKNDEQPSKYQKLN